MTDKQKAFLEHLFGEAAGNVREAMTMAGYSKNTTTHEVTGPLEEEIYNLTKSYLSSIGPKAALAINSVLDKPQALGNRERLAAAKDILDRDGHKPKEEMSVEVESPLFILPAKDRRQ